MEQYIWYRASNANISSMQNAYLKNENGSNLLHCRSKQNAMFLYSSTKPSTNLQNKMQLPGNWAQGASNMNKANMQNVCLKNENWSNLLYCRRKQNAMFVYSSTKPSTNLQNIMQQPGNWAWVHQIWKNQTCRVFA